MDKKIKQVTIADIFRFFNPAPFLTGPESKVVNAIQNCQTAVLGGHKYECEGCKAQHIAYNSCNNRHCVQCQFIARARWVKARLEELLPVQYFHVVFTIPAVLRLVFLQNKKLCFTLLFKATQETLKAVAEKKLKAKVGCVAVLHTWTQKLEFHPHIHMIVPGGGLSLDGKKWISSKRDYFLPVRALSKVFRGKLLSLLESNFNNLTFKGELDHIKTEADFKILLINAAQEDFVVYCKKPFAGPTQVIKYLGHYTHRVAISNNRIKTIEENGDIVFSYRDSKDDNQIKETKLLGLEFINRFLKHILPPRSNKIRYYGFLGRRAKKKELDLCRKLLNAKSVEKAEPSFTEIFNECFGFDPTICQKCKIGHLKIIEVYHSKLRPKKYLDST